MSVNIFFSNQLELLGERLSDNQREEIRENINIFPGSSILVPNNNLKKWLQIEIARHLGIAANIKFSFLERGLWELLCGLDNSGETIEFIDKDALRLMILFLIRNLDKNDKDFAPIRDYLLIDGQYKRSDYTRRIWQLSERLAMYFREYEYHRMEMVGSWLSGKGHAKNENSMELCQMLLYRKLFSGDDGLCLNIAGKRRMTLSQYANLIFSRLKNEKINRGETKKRAHLFGLSQISQFHQYLIANLGEHYDIDIYTFNPCCEFWEDVETPGEKRWRMIKNAGSLSISESEFANGELEEADNLLLQWWGKPGRENIRLMSEITDYNFHELYCLNDLQEAENDTVLQRLQRHILFRTASGKDADCALSQDRSLQITACPGVFREVETVYNSIIFNMEDDKSLNLTDIAILVPDMGKYKSAVTSVFNRKPAHISYNLIDSTAEKESVFGRAVIDLLKLAEGSFNRREVFSLVLNPCFLSKFKIERQEARAWVKWADELNVFRGFDTPNPKNGQYSDVKAHTWQNGMKRLRFGRIMDVSENSEIFGRFNDYKSIVPYNIALFDDEEFVERFCAVLEILRNRIMTLRHKQLSCADWRDKITGLINEFLDIPDEYPQEERIRHSLFNGLQELAIYDNFGYSDHGNSSVDIKADTNALFDHSMIIEFIKAKLKTISSSYGAYLTGGVTVSELQPMRPIPFKIMYIMGMGEGEFPGKHNQSILDLRPATRKIGDVNKTEADRYMFLEALASTRKKLYLTYVSKDLKKDEDFMPCSIILQIRQYIEAEILHNSAHFKIEEVPLQGHNKIYLKDSTDNWSDVLVNFSETDRLACLTGNSLINKATVNRSGKFAGQKYWPDINIEDKNANAAHELEKITLRRLRQFLENPAAFSIKRDLNIYDEEINDKYLAENEPFFSKFPLDYSIEMDSLEHFVNNFKERNNNAVEIEVFDYFDNYYKSCVLTGTAPGKGFNALDKKKLKTALKSRFPKLLELFQKIENSDKLIRWVFLGNGNAVDKVKSRGGSFTDRFRADDLTVREKGELELPPLRLELHNETKIEIHGSIPIIWLDKQGWNTLVITTKQKTSEKLPEKQVLEPFLFYIAMVSCETGKNIFKNKPFTIHYICREQVKSWMYNISSETAKEYINNLMNDFFAKNRFDLIPFEAVLKLSKDFDRNLQSNDINLEQIRNKYKKKLEDLIDDDVDLSELLELSKAKSPKDAFDKVNSRFALFFAAKEVAS